MIKGCIFDLDGVLVDTARYHFQAWRWLAQSMGGDFTEQQNEQLKGVSRMDSLDLILKWNDIEKSEAERLELAAKKNEHYLSLIQQMDSAEILPGILPFLEELQKENIKLAVGSASKNAKRILRAIGLYDHFETIVDGTMTTYGKPNPEVFDIGADHMDLEPNECIVIEDAPKGVQAALAGGFWSVGIGDPQVLSAAHLVFRDTTELDWELIKELVLSPANA